MRLKWCAGDAFRNYFIDLLNSILSDRAVTLSNEIIYQKYGLYSLPDGSEKRA